MTRDLVFRLNEFNRLYQCRFVDGRVTASSGLDDIAQVASDDAARAVADYAYEIRQQAEYDFRVVLIDRLKEIAGSRVRDTEGIKGTSGTRYRVPIILDPSQSRAQNFVSAIANRSIVPRSVAMFFDVGPVYPEVERDAVYDHEADIRKEDKALLKSVSTKDFPFTAAAVRFRVAPPRLRRRPNYPAWQRVSGLRPLYVVRASRPASQKPDA